MTRLLLVCILLSSAALTSEAQADDGTVTREGMGVGIASLLSGQSGPSLVYQGANFHVEGILGLIDRRNDTTTFLGGRGYFQVHSGELSDLSLGGGLGFVRRELLGGSDTDLHLELGAKIRIFLAPNVALSTSLGIGLVADDARDTITISGRLSGQFGITYFFF